MSAVMQEEPVDTGTVPKITVDGDTMTIAFRSFDLDSYPLFLRVKTLPESTIAYSWQDDAYEITTSSRFAAMLDADTTTAARDYVDGYMPRYLFDYQAWAVRMAFDAKRYALWADTGLGKTAMYLAWTDLVLRRGSVRLPSMRRYPIAGYENVYPRVLIIAPKSIHPQIIAEMQRFYPKGRDGYVPAFGNPLILETREDLITWCKGEWPEPVIHTGEMDPERFHQDHHEIAIVNYEKFIAGPVPELRYLTGLVADESGILKTGGGTIKWNLIKSARGIEYKLSCTATPAPNETMEYASQAGFLENRRSGNEIIWTYFQRDRHGVWSIKPHAKDAFYRFMSSWSLYMRNPATFGFRDILASLPAPVMHEEQVAITDDQRERMLDFAVRSGKGLFAEASLGVKERAKFAQMARGFLYRGTGKHREIEPIASNKPDRVAEIAVDEMRAGRRVLIWTAFDAEGEILQRLIPGAAILTGSMGDDERAETLEAFKTGQVRCLISKPSLIGYGLNLQFVTSMIFSGIDDSMERRYQAIRRAYRFGQTEPVHVWTVYVPELEGVMFENVAQKERRFLDEVTTQDRMYRAALDREHTR